MVLLFIINTLKPKPKLDSKKTGPKKAKQKFNLVVSRHALPIVAAMSLERSLQIQKQ